MSTRTAWLLVLLCGCGPSTMELEVRQSEYLRGKSEAYGEVQDRLDAIVNHDIADACADSLRDQKK